YVMVFLLVYSYSPLLSVLSFYFFDVFSLSGHPVCLDAALFAFVQFVFVLFAFDLALLAIVLLFLAYLELSFLELFVLLLLSLVLAFLFVTVCLIAPQSQLQLLTYDF